MLRQTLIAMVKDAALTEHANPGEASVHVLRGRVLLAADGQSWEGRDGDLLIIPDSPHSLQALQDSVVLLTVAKRPNPPAETSRCWPADRSRNRPPAALRTPPHATSGRAITTSSTNREAAASSLMTR